MKNVLFLLLLITSCQFKSSNILIREKLTLDPDVGRKLVATYGCASCHRINGVSDNPGNLAPPLKNWKRRKYIAGVLPNTPENLVRWIVAPQKILPGSAMPDYGVTEIEAWEMANYLYTQ